MSYRSEVSCIQIMAPFLWYLYCEPSQLQEYAKLRLALLKVLLQPQVLCDKDQPSILEQQILQLCCDMVPCLQVRSSSSTNTASASVSVVIVTDKVVLENKWFGKLRHDPRSRNAYNLLGKMKKTKSRFNMSVLCLMLTKFTEIINQHSPFWD